MEKEAYIRILFVIKGLYLKPFWGPRGVLWSYKYAGCHSVEHDNRHFVYHPLLKLGTRRLQGQIQDFRKGGGGCA